MNEQEQLKSEKIKQILACPKCGGEIEIKSDAGFCLACGQSFKIKDEVFLFAKKSMFDVEHRTLSEGSKIDGLMEKSKLFFKKWPNLFSVFYYAFGASFVGLSSKKAIKNLGKDKIIINLGSGIKTIRDDVINIDFVDFKNVSITADVSQLPIKNNAVDGVVCEVLLEHTKNPAKIVKGKGLFRMLIGASQFPT